MPRQGQQTDPLPLKKAADGVFKLMDNREWIMENGEWGMGNGEWGMENGELTLLHHNI